MFDPAAAGALGPLALHHVAIVVRDLATARERYAALGFPLPHAEEVADQRVLVETFALATGYVELIQPTDPDGPIARFLDKRGEGLHHVAYEVDDLARALRDLAARGVRLIDERPRRGAHGWNVAFVHPEACAGVLTELVEEPQ
ncbi:MAG TPA: methylmalonyl-CoA epimerase [Thermomicrobiales bacterium]|jgi:methylmalonyl-CoA/ethylmalonyl-CoA epimerase|nr:methylmalonyl-CoA epimerase [Thermomicrobiales bacterium]